MSFISQCLTFEACCTLLSWICFSRTWRWASNCCSWLILAARSVFTWRWLCWSLCSSAVRDSLSAVLGIKEWKVNAWEMPFYVEILGGILMPHQCRSLCQVKSTLSKNETQVDLVETNVTSCIASPQRRSYLHRRPRGKCIEKWKGNEKKKKWKLEGLTDM